MVSVIGVIILIVALKFLFFLLYWFCVDMRKKARARQSDPGNQEQLQPRDQEQLQQQQQQRQQQPQFPRLGSLHPAVSPPPAYDDIVKTNKYPIYVISPEVFDGEAGIKPPTYEFAVGHSTSDATAVQTL